MIVDHPYYYTFNLKDSLNRLEKSSRKYMRLKVPQSVKGVLITKDNRILLMRRPGLKAWDLPGGGVDKGESLARAYMREVREECGLKVDNASALYSFERRFKSMEYKIIHYVGTFVDKKSKNLTVRLSAEHDEYGFFKWSEIKDLELIPSYLKALKLARHLMMKPRKAWYKLNKT